MAVNLWLNTFPQEEDINGAPLSGGWLYFYAAGSSTKQTTFTTSAGTIPNANPMQLDASGRPQQAVWLTVGTLYKVALAEATESDPPSNFIWSLDNVAGIQGVGSSSSSADWTLGPTPTYLSPTSFSVVGDQTAIFKPGRAVQIVDSGGTKYGFVKTSVFGVVTTVTLDQNSDALANPTSTVSYGGDPANPSVPLLSDIEPIRRAAADESVQWGVTLTGNTTGQTRKTIIPDYNHRMMTQTHGADIAASATLNLDTATGDLIDVTGNTGITAVTLADGKAAMVRFTGTPTITVGASLILTGNVSRPMAVGDYVLFRGYAAGVVRGTYFPISGQPITAPTSFQGASLALIDSAVAVGSAAIAFTSGINSTYDAYKIIMVSVVPSINGAQMLMRMSINGGSSYENAAGSYAQALTSMGANGTTYTGNTTSFTDIVLTATTNGISNTANQLGMDLELTIFRPAQTAGIKKLSGFGGYAGSVSLATMSLEAAGISGTLVGSAVNAVQFLMSSGTFTGNFYLYGVKKS